MRPHRWERGPGLRVPRPGVRSLAWSGCSQRGGQTEEHSPGNCSRDESLVLDWVGQRGRPAR